MQGHRHREEKSLFGRTRYFRAGEVVWDRI
jgi:hypothetical protein